MASCCLPKIKSRVRGHHVYKYTFKVGEILNCNIENVNKYGVDAIAVFSSSKKMICHIPEPLAKIIFPLMKCWKILEIKIEISGEKTAAPVGTWMLGGGGEIPAALYVCETRVRKLHFKNVIKNADAE